MRVERRLKGWKELLKLVEGQTGQIEELCGAGPHVGEPYTGHTWCLLSWETQYTTNRDKLNCRDGVGSRRRRWWRPPACVPPPGSGVNGPQGALPVSPRP